MQRECARIQARDASYWVLKWTRVGFGSLIQHLEQLSSRRLIKRAGELSDGRRGLQAVVEDGALALQPNILGPLHVTAEVADGLQAVADGE